MRDWLTLVEVYVHMPGLRQREHANKLSILVFKLLAPRRKLLLAELPEPPLR